MKKLEEIPKKEVFKVPEGYFEKLPGIIQSRVAVEHKNGVRPVFSFALRFALPAILLAAVGIFWLNREQVATTPESILASIQTEDLVAYLNTADLTTEELLDHVILDTEDANEIEQEVYGLDLSTEADVDDLLNEIDLNSL